MVSLSNLGTHDSRATYRVLGTVVVSFALGLLGGFLLTPGIENENRDAHAARVRYFDARRTVDNVAVAATAATVPSDVDHILGGALARSAALVTAITPLIAPRAVISAPSMLVPLGAARVAVLPGTVAGAEIVLNPPLANEISVPFYVYDDPVHNPNLCYDNGGYESIELPRKGYWCTGTEWAIQAKKHPWRVMDPAKARIFVIPLDVCESFATRGKCDNKFHVDRVNEIFFAVEQSPWYKRNGGRDHFWSITHNVLPPAMLGKKKMGERKFAACFLSESAAEFIDQEYDDWTVLLLSPNVQ
jgi:hypothetical protein